MREYKFRAYHGLHECMIPNRDQGFEGDVFNWKKEGQAIIIMQSTGITDKNGTDIYDGDILEFSDKWEWYRGQYGIKMNFADTDTFKELQAQYELEPMERREIQTPGDYEWLLSGEIQQWWHVIGNIHENPNLMETP